MSWRAVSKFENGRSLTIEKIEAGKNGHTAWLPKEPMPRSGHRIVAFNNFIVMIGGANADLIDRVNTVDTVYPILKEVWIQNLITGIWTEVETTGPMPYELASSSVAIHDNKIYVFGGTSYPFSLSSSNKLYTLDIATWHWTLIDCKDPPTPRYGQAMVIYNNSIYVTGGVQATGSNMVMYALSLTDAYKQWMAIENSEWTGATLHRSEMVIYKEKIYIFGGNEAGNAETFIYSFCPSSNVWIPVTAKPDPIFGLPAPREALSVALIGSNAFIAGGITNEVIHKDIWRINLDTLAWQKMDVELPQQLCFHGCSVTTDKSRIIIYAGMTSALPEKAYNRHTYQILLKPRPLWEIAMIAVLKINKDILKKTVEDLRQMGIPRWTAMTITAKLQVKPHKTSLIDKIFDIF